MVKATFLVLQLTAFLNVVTPLPTLTPCDPTVENPTVTSPTSEDAFSGSGMAPTAALMPTPTPCDPTVGRFSSAPVTAVTLMPTPTTRDPTMETTVTSTSATSSSVPLYPLYVVAIMGSSIVVLVILVVILFVILLVVCAKSRLCKTAKHRKQLMDLQMEPLNNFSEPDNVNNNNRVKTTTAMRKTRPLNIPNATILSNLNAELQLAVTHNHSNSSLKSIPQHHGAVPSVNSLGTEEEIHRATPPIPKPRRKTPVSTPRKDLSKRSSTSSQIPMATTGNSTTTSPANAASNLTSRMVTASSKMHPVVAHENLQRCRSEGDLLCPSPAETSRTRPVPKRQSELTASTGSYPYVVHSWEMQGPSLSMPNLSPFLPLVPRSESTSSSHASCESLYAKPLSPKTPEPQPYLEFQPVYSYAYGKLPLKYQTIASPKTKTLPSPRHSVGMPWRDVTRARNATVNIVQHGPRPQSNDNYENVDPDSMANDLNLKPRGTLLYPPVAGVENQLVSPDYAEIDSSFVHFHSSPPGRDTMSKGIATEKQEETMQSTLQKDSPRLEKVEGMQNKANRTHIRSENPNHQTTAASKQPSRHMNRQKTNSQRMIRKDKDDDAFQARGSSDPTKLKESTRHGTKRSHGHSKVTSNTSHPEQHAPDKRASHHTSTSSDDLYDHLNQLEMQ